jgi:integrase
VALYGGSALVDFRADELKAVREAMISGGWDEPDPEHPEKRRARSWSRGHANACINKLKRLFRWGLEHDYVPAENAAMIGAVPPLKKGRTTARELPPVHPVAEQVIDATLPHLPPVVWAMVELQRITGMRSDNLCSMRPCDVDRAAPVWIYRPAAHKESHADKELLVPLGPRAQAILQPYLERPANMPCFSPREAPNRKPTGKRGPGTRYNARSYCHAVYKGCDRAGVPRWHPHQLRHNAAIAAKSARGVEGARAYLGTR